MPTTVHGVILLLGGLFSILAFFMFSHNRFTVSNLIVGLVAVCYVILGVHYSSKKLSFETIWQSLRQPWLKFIRSRPNQTWGIIIIALVVTALALFFRFYRLSSVPGDMFSDHAEKLLDVWDVLNG